MDLDFKLLETGSLFVSVIVTAFTLQVQHSSLLSLNCKKFQLISSRHFRISISEKSCSSQLAESRLYFLKCAVEFVLLALIKKMLNLIALCVLQDGTSHYLKGILLLLCYIVIGACFFVTRQPAGMLVSFTAATSATATTTTMMICT